MARTGDCIDSGASPPRTSLAQCDSVEGYLKGDYADTYEDFDRLVCDRAQASVFGASLYNLGVAPESTPQRPSVEC